MTNSTPTPRYIPSDIEATRDREQGHGTGETPKLPEQIPHFETSDVEANLALEQGLGVGARELAAQRDPGGIVTPDEDEAAEGEALDRTDVDQADPSI